MCVLAPQAQKARRRRKNILGVRGNTLLRPGGIEPVPGGDNVCKMTIDKSNFDENVVVEELDWSIQN
eukprot:m.411711 g.411711  ORF g.411711 m.411711 type:complete len:67 (-) comp16816_c0_seq42:1603-1803(-)